MIYKLIKGIKEPRLLALYILSLNVFRRIPDKLFLKIKFFLCFKEKLDLVQPKTFNEKLQWLKLYDRKSIYIKFVDKYEVRAYIEKFIGADYLIPLISVYNSVEEIIWNDLPQKFVLKCTHGSGANIICLDKKNLDIKNAKLKLNKWMKKNWFWYGREWPYKSVQPRIVCEKFLTSTGKIPDDYKVLCFNGKAKIIEVHIDRFDNHKQDFYDEKWNKISISQENTKSNFFYEKPKRFDEMIRLSEKISANMYHSRVDWYIVDDKLYFGEITFYDGAGFIPFDDKKDDYFIGNLLKLPID